MGSTVRIAGDIIAGLFALVAVLFLLDVPTNPLGSLVNALIPIALMAGVIWFTRREDTDAFDLRTTAFRVAGGALVSLWLVMFILSITAGQLSIGTQIISLIVILIPGAALIWVTIEDKDNIRIGA